VTYGIVVNGAKAEAAEALSTLLDAMKRRKLDVVVQAVDCGPGGIPAAKGSSNVSGPELVTRSSMIVALGGDGTMLSVARQAGPAGIPILGVNLGRLGFLAEVSLEEIGACLDDIAAGRHTVEERLALTARTASGGAPLTALNEIVIDRGDHPRPVDFDVRVDGDLLATYSADGILVTTPTGSTAYSLAAGGPIVTPSSDVLTITPISAHTLTARPVVVPSGTTITVTVTRGLPKARVVADGQQQQFDPVPCECTVRRADYRVRLVKWKPGSYFKLLRKKLLLGRGLRTEAGEPRGPASET
jgi:NAD+ kinase